MVAAELLNSLSEKFGWADVQVLVTYRGSELNQIVTEHPWDTAVDELVTLVTTLQQIRYWYRPYSSWFLVRMTTMSVLLMVLKLL